MTTITRSSKIGEIAEKLVDGILTPYCKVRKENPDIHIDFIAEIEQHGEPTGKRVGIQVKGTENPKIKDGVIKFTFETKSLRYYAENMYPIFLIVVDVKNREGYWLFTQKMLNENPILQNKENQKTITLNISLQNKITETLAFIEIADAAQKYMRELWPSSLHAAACAEKKKLQDLDNRFDVNVKYDNGAETIQCVARDRVDFSLHLKSENRDILKEKLINLFDRGQRVEFPPQELQIKGSPLFEEFSKHNFLKITLEASCRKPAELHLTVVDHQDQPISKAYRIDGEFIFGRKLVRFESKKNNLPLNLTLNIPLPETCPNSNEEYSKHDSALHFDDTAWEGKAFHNLPYFDAVSSFFYSLKAGCRICLSFEHEGNLIFKGYVPNPFKESFVNNMSGFCMLVEKIRFIAKYLGINFTYPVQHSYPKEEVKNIHMIYALLKDGKFQIDGAGQKLKAVLQPNECFFSTDKDKIKGGAVAVEAREKVFNLFGEVINLGPLRYTITDSRLLTKIDFEAIRLLPLPERKIFLEWEGKEGAQFIITRI